MSTSRKRAGDPPAVDQVWRNKREPWRRLRIVAVYTAMDNGGEQQQRVHVRRTTSRRTQSMSVDTLHKDYSRDELA